MQYYHHVVITSQYMTRTKIQKKKGKTHFNVKRIHTAYDILITWNCAQENQQEGANNTGAKEKKNLQPSLEIRYINN